MYIYLHVHIKMHAHDTYADIEGEQINYSKAINAILDAFLYGELSLGVRPNEMQRGYRGILLNHIRITIINYEGQLLLRVLCEQAPSEPTG